MSKTISEELRDEADVLELTPSFSQTAELMRRAAGQIESRVTMRHTVATIGDRSVEDMTQIEVFDNGQLADAIKVAYASIGSLGTGDPRFNLSVEHYRALLKEQLKRATK